MANQPPITNTEHSEPNDRDKNREQSSASVLDSFQLAEPARKTLEPEIFVEIADCVSRTRRLMERINSIQIDENLDGGLEEPWTRQAQIACLPCYLEELTLDYSLRVTNRFALLSQVMSELDEEYGYISGWSLVQAYLKSVSDAVRMQASLDQLAKADEMISTDNQLPEIMPFECLARQFSRSGVAKVMDAARSVETGCRNIARSM